MAFKGKTDFYCADFEKRGDKECVMLKYGKILQTMRECIK